MRPETASLRSLSHPGSLALLEKNFDFDLLTPAKMLEKNVGRNVRIVRLHPTTDLPRDFRTSCYLRMAPGLVES
jgi:hypothetical protein